ncbi:ABC transporter substrate-binding protein [Aquibacillus salsiterrae]|uniref:ABC transporter substrate-binding protein n=1 Tax=Aquibacillus salsiterrae TaxID=2950439 RepID=A0A9X3WEB3_9BACI|nr:ABC transporter substrate-binding protein [Aquibacillus salsiterrae]MDC3416625.1 ABC transporter substrate-binding protein [Aquibacillus salsiterrae]
MSINKMKFLVFLLMFISFGLITGCSSGDQTSTGDSNADSGSGGGKGKTTITFWHSMTDTSGDAVEEVIKEFEKQNPDIKVNASYIANQGEGQNEKLLTAIAGGNPPDVAYFDRFEVASWAAQGSLEKLTDLAESSGITQDKYYPFSWKEASYEGDLYAIPTTTDSRLLFYNKDQFEEVGLDPENPPSTIAELEEAAKKLTIKDGNRFKRIGFIPWYGQGWFYGWGWSFGGKFYDSSTQTATANNPKNVEALQWITDFAKEYGVEDIAGFTDSQGSGAMDPFLTGQLSMKIDGNFGVASIEKFKPDLNYGVAPMPTPTGDNFTTWSGGWSVVIPKGAKNKEAAWEFLKFFGGEEGQKIFSKISRDFSVIDSVNEELGYKDDPIFSQFIKILPESHARPVMTQGSLYWNELASAVEGATRGNGTPEEILTKVNEKVNSALKE